MKLFYFTATLVQFTICLILFTPPKPIITTLHAACILCMASFLRYLIQTYISHTSTAWCWNKKKTVISLIWSHFFYIISIVFRFKKKTIEYHVCFLKQMAINDYVNETSVFIRFIQKRAYFLDYFDLRNDSSHIPLTNNLTLF